MTESSPLAAGLKLGGAALLCCGMLAALYQLAAPAIQRNEQQHEHRSISVTLKRDLGFTPATLHPCNSAQEAHDPARNPTRYLGWYVTGEDEAAHHVVIRSSARGYGGPLDLLLSLDGAHTIEAIDVVAHQETPGLGDIIERRKSDWLAHYLGIQLTPSQDTQQPDRAAVDQLTGATITARAVSRAVEAAQNLLQQSACAAS